MRGVLSDGPVTIATLERHGLVLWWSTKSRDGEERYDHGRRRWYFLEGYIFECTRPLPIGLWKIMKLDLVWEQESPTGPNRRWTSPP